MRKRGDGISQEWTGMVGTTQEIKKTWGEGKAGEAPKHVQ